MKTRMTIKQQIIKAVDMSNKKKHTEDCIDANDDMSVFQGECICPKTNPPHTPGPWVIANGNEIVAYPSGRNAVTVAVSHGPAGRMGDVGSEHEANARLIAAAPEMKTMLENCREFILRFDSSDEEEIAMSERILALLDKAEGK